MASFFQRLKRRLAAPALPPRVLILLTNPRSGSTWLFDALRCHPAIAMEPGAAIFERLHLNGRRYPRDLCDGPGAALRVEVLPEKWAMIPAFSVEGAEQFVSPEVLRQPYAIEKGHPHFFDHYVRGFVHDLRALDRRGAARVVYQVRDPQSSIISFLRYKERNPRWNSTVSADEAFAHTARIFETLADTAALYPGLVIDYADMVHNFDGAIGGVFDFLWPDEPRNGRDPELLRRIAEATARDRRKKAGTPFLAGEAGPVSGTRGEYEEQFAAHADELARCYAAYRTLLAQRPGKSETV